MKYTLPILIIAFALVVLGGTYLYSTRNKPNDSTSVLNYTTTSGTKGGSFEATAGRTVTPAPTPTSLNQIKLAITSPVNNTTVTTPALTVTGTTLASADVTVNDVDIKADANGNFSTTITLDEGENTVIVVASDPNGNASEQELIITYTPVQ